jgi:hypothetical protein
MIALCLWIVLDSTVIGDGSGSGVGGWITRAIGPDGVRLGALVLAVALAAFVLAYLRLLLSSSSLAVGADRERLTLRSALGDGSWTWPEVEALFVRRVPTPGGEQMLVMVRPRSGRERGVACNAVRETADEVESWVEAAEELRLAAIGRF